MDKIEIAPQVNSPQLHRDRAMGYVRIEAERAGELVESETRGRMGAEEGNGEGAPGER